MASKSETLCNPKFCCNHVIKKVEQKLPNLRKSISLKKFISLHLITKCTSVLFFFEQEP